MFLKCRDLQIKTTYNYVVLKSEYQINSQQMQERCEGEGINILLLIGLKTGKATMEICAEKSQIVSVNLSHNPPIAFLGICLKDSTSYSTSTSWAMLITALLTIAQNLMQLKSLSTYTWIIILVYVYIIKYYSSVMKMRPKFCW